MTKKLKRKLKKTNGGFFMLGKLIIAGSLLAFVGPLSAEGRGWLRGESVLDSSSDVHVMNVATAQPKVGEEFDVYRIFLDTNPAQRGMRHRYKKIGRVRVAEIVDPHGARATVIWGLSGGSYLIETK
ncbi:MAG: hypothetical protein K1X70_19700 [Leptospirales bacterium]|nr:hypothetical protein [Leptospirales bacterium]HNN76428.1 hypothetical protein [Leptospiraceae bacterium]